jgi:diguanylate cyclase (GGDEF)-like protein/putative nucleotidyltransferase with HDIG domain
MSSGAIPLRPAPERGGGTAVLPSDRLPEQEAEGKERLPLKARVYLFSVVALAGVATLATLLGSAPDVRDWALFALFAACAATAQLFVVRTPRNQNYHTTVVFLVPAILLLPPQLVALVAIVQHVPEWLKVRYPWHIQGFNIGNYVLNALAAWAAATGVSELSLGSSAIGWALAGIVACAVFVGTNHVLLAFMLHLARGHGLRASGLFTLESVSTDLILAALGLAVATLCETNAWLVPVAIAPLVLIHRSLSVPALQEEVRLDPKTGLFNARHFAVVLREELTRASRLGRPVSVIMADLDLLRDINNTYGHLAGDAVLQGIADIFRTQLRHYDVPARFGGEEFAVLLPDTDPELGLEIAERIRRAVAARLFEVETSSEPIRATVSLGVAGFPGDATDANELVHQADLAVYRAKLQGRNRALGASAEPLAVPDDRAARLAVVPEDGPHTTLAPRAAVAEPPPVERRDAAPRPHAPASPHLLTFSPLLAGFVGAIALIGIAAGALGIMFGSTGELLGLVSLVVLVGAGQALALELEGGGSISVSAVGALAGAALAGPRAALPIAVAIVAVQWSAQREAWHYVLFNLGALTLAGLGAAAAFTIPGQSGELGTLITAVAGLGAGACYYAVNTGLTSAAMALEGHERWRSVWTERFAWLLPHYVAFGVVGGAIALAFQSIGLYGLAVFALPLVLMRKTMATYVGHAVKSATKLRAAAETIHEQNVSLEHANRLLKERSTAAMESLSATVDARDAYTAGHSRRVQQLALAIGRQLGMSQAELDLLGHAALFHDIGKLAIPDAILLKPAGLTADEWTLMQRHAEEGARIIERLGFLQDAVPAIRHHHERYDGSGYPDGVAGEEIPLGARGIHVADALDSMLTTRIYRAARPADEALAELRRGAGAQFCPRTVTALEALIASDELDRSLVRSQAQDAVAATG